MNSNSDSSLSFDFLNPEDTPLWVQLSPGLKKGDPLTESLLSIPMLAKIGHNPQFAISWLREHVLDTPDPQFAVPSLQLGTLPPWMDLSSAARGQAVLLRHFCSVFTLLIAILFNGFVISRFAQVLVMAGYAKNPRETYLRFRSTAVHIWMWLRFSLSDPLSPARISLLQVRCMHGLARHVAQTRGGWDQKTQFVPLSQFDTSLVLLGFSSIILESMSVELKISLSQQEQRDVIHFWRAVGWHLGLQDAYNPCTTLPQSLDMLHEFYRAIVPHLSTHILPSSLLLLRSSITGFGLYTPMSVDVAEAIMFLQSPDRDYPVDRSWTGIPRPNSYAYLLLTCWVSLCTRFWIFSYIFNFIFESLLSLSRKSSRIKTIVEHFYAFVWSPFFHYVFYFLDYYFPLNFQGQVSNHNSTLTLKQK